jgi:hypothetical protein
MTFQSPRFMGPRLTKGICKLPEMPKLPKIAAIGSQNHEP